jgi:hypothetical protein
MGLGSDRRVVCDIMPPMRGRTKRFGLGAIVVVLGLAAVGAWRYEEHVHRQPDWQIHHTAVPDAAKKVNDLLAQFERDHLYKAGDYLHSVGQHPDVQVLRNRADPLADRRDRDTEGDGPRCGARL